MKKIPELPCNSGIFLSNEGHKAINLCHPIERKGWRKRMKKSGKFIGCILCICLLFSGCHQASAQQDAGPDLVTSVSVIYNHKNTHFNRIYTQERKMDIILYYFYSLSPKGHADKDPEDYLGERCKVIVTLSSGKTHIYRQFGTEYLSVDHRPWQKIDKSQASVLFHLLLHMESDE